MPNPTTIYGRQDVAWPDLGSDPGSVLHSQITSAIAYLSNNVTARWSGSLTLAASGTAQIIHNFDSAIAGLKVFVIEAGAVLSKATQDARYTFTQVNVDTVQVQNISGTSRTFQVYIYPSGLNIRAADLDPAIDLDTTGKLAIGGRFAAAQAANSQSGSDVTLTDPATAAVALTNSALLSVTGITAPVDATGKIVIYHNTTTNLIEFKHLSGATAANQIVTGTGSSLYVPAGASVMLRYDTVNSKWRVIAMSGIVESLDPVEVAGIPPSLDLDFSADVPSTVTFSRNSIATYFAQDGYLKTASANVPRIEYDPVTRNVKGLLIEEARSNLLFDTENFTSTGSLWSHTSLAVSPNAALALDGSQTATLLYPSTSGTASRYITDSISSLSASTTYTLSVYAKLTNYVSGVNGIALRFRNSSDSSGMYVNFNLIDGTVSGGAQSGSDFSNRTGSIQSLGDGWYRCILTVTVVNALTNPLVEFWYGAYSNGVSSTTGQLYIWGAQLEAGAFPTSYIPSQQTWTARTGTGGTAVASYYDSTGLLKFTGVARTTYNPSPDKLHLSPKLLLEPEATNICQQSESFATAPWLKGAGVTITSNTITAPDGAVTADTIAKDTTQFQTVHFDYSASIGDIRTFSVFVKAGTATKTALGMTGDTTAPSGTWEAVVSFDLATKAITVDTNNGLLGYGIQELTNGWYRIYVSTKLTMSSAPRNFVYIGARTSTTAENLYLWGAQLEAGYAPTSYIPTTTATVKRYADTYTSAVLSGGRLADSASMTGSNFSGWYRWDEGTMYCEADRASTTAYSTRWHISDSSGANVIRSIGYNDDTDRLCNITLETVPQSITTLTNATTSMTKYSAAFALNNVIGYGSGVGTLLDTTCLIPTKVTTLYVGSNSAGSFTLNGHIRRLIFWPLRISNDKLQKMTV